MDQVDIIGKLSELSTRIEAKEQLSVKYKDLVKARLATISDKIKNLLTRQKEMVTKIKEDSKKNLTDLGKKLGDMKTQVKQQGDDALKDAQGTSDDMKKNLDTAVSDLEKLREQMRQPNPDLENMRALVKKLEDQLKDSTNKQDEYELNMRELQTQLQLKDTTIEQLTSSMTDAINMIVDLVSKVEKMSINNEDIDEIAKLLDDVEKQLDVPEDSGNSGSGDDGLGIADMFKEAAETVESAVTPEPQPEIKNINDPTEIVEIDPTIEEGTWKDVGGEEPLQLNTQEVAMPPSDKSRKTRSRKDRQELSSATNREKYGKDLAAMTKAAGVGGKTRRNRKKGRTIKKRGGYVIKKTSSRSSSRKRKNKNKGNDKDKDKKKKSRGKDSKSSSSKGSSSS